MLKTDHQVGRQSSYWSRPEYHALLNSSADVIVLMLGTNDARSDRWQAFGAQFQSDYTDMLASFEHMDSNPTIHVMVPPPLYENGVYQGMNQTVINSIFPGVGQAGIGTIAKKAGSIPRAVHARPR